jgi:hypothetical protein
MMIKLKNYLIFFKQLILINQDKLITQVLIKILEFLVCLVDETIIDEKKLQDAFNYMDFKKQKNICADGLF